MTKHFLWGALLLACTGVAFGNIKFSATTERTTVSMDEQIIVNATLVTSKQYGTVGIPKVPQTDGFSILRTEQRQSSSSSIQITNGQAVQKTEIFQQFFYIISPSKTGVFTFPSLQVTLDGKEYKTDPITFTVKNEAVANPDIRVMLQLSKKNLFVGEQASFTFKIAQRAQSSTEVRNGFLPALEKIEKAFGKDFSLSRLFTNQVATSSERIDGEIYNVYSLKFIVHPLSAGTFTIASIPFEFQELRRVQNRRSDPFFDDFFDINPFGGGVQAIPKNAFSNNLTITVTPLPPAPANFNGSVGKFSISSSVNPLEIPAGEAVTLRVTMRGSNRPGSIGEIVLPQINDCDVFKPEIQTTSDTTATGINTRKNYKYLLIPKQEGPFTIPEISMTYFDPEAETYKTATTSPLVITVTKGKGDAKPQNRYLSQEEIRAVGSDIRFIKTGGKITNQSERPYREPIFFLVFPLPFIILIFSILFKFQMSQQQKNAAVSTRRRAKSVAQKRIDVIRKKSKSLSSSEFLGAVAETIEQYISQKFGFAATGRTLDELKTQLLSLNSDEKTVAELTLFIEHLDTFRFGGMQLDENSRNTILEKAVTFLNGLEKGVKRDKKSMPKSIFTLILLFTLCSVLYSAPVDQWFESANRFYSNQNYDSAAVYYQKILDSGTSNSTVLYNLGNTWFRLKKPGLARLYYEKAARLNPEDPDIAANIRFINSILIDKVQEPERGFIETVFWHLHILFPLKTQLWMLAGLLFFISVFISACFYISGNTRLWLIYISILLTLISGAIGISSGYKIYDLEKVTYAILLSPSIDAKNEPDGNKILFTAHEGTKFRIRKTEGEWCLVSLPNGFSGWVENKNLGSI
ncbi:MAG: tetratricopeptide repeat protein [Fibrobacter sp.]|nr:tetratricopeptide repeat protein [Fibrobacter sp.]